MKTKKLLTLVTLFDFMMYQLLKEYFYEIDTPIKNNVHE